MAKHFFAAGYSRPDVFDAFGVGKTPKTAYRQAYRRSPSIFGDPRDCIEITEREFTSLGYWFGKEPIDRGVNPANQIGAAFQIDAETAAAALIIRRRV